MSPLEALDELLDATYGGEFRRLDIRVWFRDRARLREMLEPFAMVSQ